MDAVGLRLTFPKGDGIALLTMGNGENKFNMDYIKQWNNALDTVESNDDCRGLITVGEGRFFSTGLDMTWLRTATPQQLDEYHDQLHKLYKRIMSLGMTTVAVINGHAIADGAFIALMHDYRVMRNDKGWISWPEVHVKLPLTRTMVDLIRVKIPHRAPQREAIVFGKRLDGERAKSLGLVDVTATAENMLTEAKTVLLKAIGKMDVNNGFMNDMKTDMYNNYVSEEQLNAKL